MPTRYIGEAPAINFSRRVKYGLGVLATSLKSHPQKMGLVDSRVFNPHGQEVIMDYYHEVAKGGQR